MDDLVEWRAELCSAHEQEPEVSWPGGLRGQKTPNGVACCTMHALMQLLQWSPRVRPQGPRGLHSGRAAMLSSLLLQELGCRGHEPAISSSDYPQGRIVIVEDLPRKYRSVF